MFSQRKTKCHPTVIPFHRILLSGMLRKTFLELINCNAAPMWRFLCAKQLKNVQVLEAEKKLAWTDLDQVNFEKKIFKESTFKSKNWRGQV